MGIFGKAPGPKVGPEPSLVPVLPATAPPALAAAGPTCVIGPKTTFRGELTGDDDVVVEGTLEGQVRITRDLRVSARGTVRATVRARAVVVAGELVGECHAEGKVEIQATGRMTGDIHAPKVVIAEGAMFRGNSDMSGRKEQRPDKVAAS